MRHIPTHTNPKDPKLSPLDITDFLGNFSFLRAIANQIIMAINNYC